MSEVRESVESVASPGGDVLTTTAAATATKSDGKLEALGEPPEMDLSEMMAEVDNLVYKIIPGTLLWIKNPDARWFPGVVIADTDGSFKRVSENVGSPHVHVVYVNGDEQWASLEKVLPYHGFGNYQKYAQYVTVSASDQDESARLAKYFEIAVSAKTEMLWYETVREANRLLKCSLDERIEFVLLEKSTKSNDEDEEQKAGGVVKDDDDEIVEVKNEEAVVEDINGRKDELVEEVEKAEDVVEAVEEEKEDVEDKEAALGSPSKVEETAFDTNTVSTQNAAKQEQITTEDDDNSEQAKPPARRSMRKKTNTESTETVKSQPRRSSRIKDKSSTEKSTPKTQSGESKASAASVESASKRGRKRKSEAKEATPKRKSARLAANSGSEQKRR